MTPRLRIGVLLCALALSLLALGKRNRVRGWLWGVDAEARETPGGPAPELPATARTLDGARLRLVDLRGQVLLVHFWTFG
ncbi:MAG TPA: hypothetical protein VMZ28_10620 [Kofleriaceae bacterium]|nr:hypothetical protein [Kofleriaceae bacterium]